MIFNFFFCLVYIFWKAKQSLTKHALPKTNSLKLNRYLIDDRYTNISIENWLFQSRKKL